MTSEQKALTRLKMCERIIKDREQIESAELDMLMLYQFGILPRTVAKYVACLLKLGKIEVDGTVLKVKA